MASVRLVLATGVRVRTGTAGAGVMRDLGAVDALNLEEGGSTEMVVEGEVVNHPSDGHQRELSDAILVLPGLRPGEA